MVIPEGSVQRKRSLFERVLHQRVPWKLQSSSTDCIGKEIEVIGNIELKVNTGNPKLGNISLMVKAHLFPVHHSYLVIRQGLFTYNSTHSRPTWNRHGSAGLINMKSGLVTNITSGLSDELERWTDYENTGWTYDFHPSRTTIRNSHRWSYRNRTSGIRFQFAEYANHVHLSAVGPTTPPTTWCRK